MYQIEVLDEAGQWTTEGLGEPDEFDTEEEAEEALEGMLVPGGWSRGDEFRVSEIEEV